MAKPEKSDLSSLEKIVMLGLDDKGWFGNSENTIKFGLAGIIIFDLFDKGRLELEGGRIKVINADPVGNPVEDKVLAVFAKAKKTRSVSGWIKRLAYKKLMLRRFILKELMKKGVLAREEYNLLGIFYQNKYPLINKEIKKSVQDEIFRAVMNDEKLPSGTLLLITVMSTCKILKKNLKGRDDDSKILKRVNEMMKFASPLSKKGKLIREIRQGINRGILASRVSIHA